MIGSSRAASADEVKTTFPLAMKVSTSASFNASKIFFSTGIFTTRPPTLMARRNAT
jgi:hypothetical protein